MSGHCTLHMVQISPVHNSNSSIPSQTSVSSEKAEIKLNVESYRFQKSQFADHMISQY